MPQDVARMYTLFKRVSHGSKSLLDVLCGQLRTVGKDLVTDPERCRILLVYAPDCFVQL